MDRAARLAGSKGGYRSWVNTENRAQRMAVVQANSPTGLDCMRGDCSARTLT